MRYHSAFCQWSRTSSIALRCSPDKLFGLRIRLTSFYARMRALISHRLLYLRAYRLLTSEEHISSTSTGWLAVIDMFLLSLSSPHPREMNDTAVSRESLIFFLVSVSLTTIFIPILSAVWVFARSDIRRKPIFILNVTAIILSLTLGSLSTALEVSDSATSYLYASY